MHPLDIHWVLTFGSVTLVTLASLTGMLALSVRPRLLARVVPCLVSMAAGALLGTAFGHLLPESVERWGSGRTLSALLAASFATFFILEKAIAVYLGRSQAGEAHEHGFDANALNRGSGPGWFAIPYLCDFLHHCSMPVYPDAIPHSLLASQIAPTAANELAGQPRLLHPS